MIYNSKVNIVSDDSQHPTQPLKGYKNLLPQAFDELREQAKSHHSA
jgi:hypothetical protein